MSGAAKPTSHQKPEPEQEIVPRQSPAGSGAIHEDFSPVAELIVLERERIASRDRRTDVMRRTIDAGDAADKRQYDYHVEKLRRDDDDRKRRHASGIAIVWTLLAATIGFTGFLRWMLFAGDESATGSREQAAGDRSHGARRVWDRLGTPERHSPLSRKMTMP